MPLNPLHMLKKRYLSYLFMKLSSYFCDKVHYRKLSVKVRHCWTSGLIFILDEYEDCLKISLEYRISTVTKLNKTYRNQC